MRTHLATAYVWVSPLAAFTFVDPAPESAYSDPQQPETINAAAEHGPARDDLGLPVQLGSIALPTRVEEW